MRNKSRSLTGAEQETIIRFDEAGPEASIFTYNRTWQQHLEGKLGLKPKTDNGFGGREYELLKHRIPKPRAPRVLSPAQKAEATKRGKHLAASRKTSLLRAGT